MTDPIYLDYDGITPLDPAALEAMEPYTRDHFGNPSSDHVCGHRTRAAVHAAREQFAALLGAAPEGVVFTGGGSTAASPTPRTARLLSATRSSIGELSG